MDKASDPAALLTVTEDAALLPGATLIDEAVGAPAFDSHSEALMS